MRLQSWLTQSRNILGSVFGIQSFHYRQFEDNLPSEKKGGVRGVSRSYDVYPLVGVLSGALDDLENGFLTGQEFLIAGEVFDSILEQAKELNKNGYKDPAAVLTRIVLENALKRMAQNFDIDSTKKASFINDQLKKMKRYSQSQWRFIQAWLDIGNAAAHGKFDEYKSEDIEKVIQDLERFLVSNFHE